MAGGGKWGEGGDESSVPAEGNGLGGGTEERNLLRGPLPLMECIAVTRTPERRRPSADGLQRPLRRFFLPPPHRGGYDGTEDA